jgi:hypothetical protein
MTLLSNAVSLCSSLSVREQVLKKCKIVVQDMWMFLDSPEYNVSVISSCVIYKSPYCYMLCFVQVMQCYRRDT